MEIQSDGRCSHICFLSDPGSLSFREEIVRRIETDMAHELRKSFGEAKSHSEAESCYLNRADDPEAAQLAQQAHDRLEKEHRIREDIEEYLARVTMKMTQIALYPSLPWMPDATRGSGRSV